MAAEDQERSASERLGSSAAGEDQEQRGGSIRIGPVIAIGVIVSLLGIALGLLIDWFPIAASGEAKQIDTLWDVLLICSVPVFVLVETVVLYSVWKFRMKPGEELLDGPPIHGNTRLEVVWTAIPAILLVGAVLLRVHRAARHRDGAGQHARDEGARRRPAVHVDSSTTPARAAGRRSSSPQLYLPQNTHVKFTVQSRDVIHDFWVPAFRQKIDAVPGIDTSYLVTTTDVKGDFPVVCAELCGLGHSTMRQTAHVRDEAGLRQVAVGPARQGGAAMIRKGR